MDSAQLFLDQFTSRSEAESLWLQDIFSFIKQQVCPVCPDPPAAGGGSWSDPCVSLSVSLVKKIQENTAASHSLPVSYRPVSISELLSQQHLACFSCLSWTTKQHRAWVKEAELSLPGSKALPRVNLLLMGCLRAGWGGEWRLSDSSGSIRCEVLSPSPLWLNRPVFLPHWNYIPHNASGQDESTGWVELIGSPMLLSPGPEQGMAGAGAVVGVREAVGVLQHRVRGQRVSVCGQVGSVCPVLAVAGTMFFCFTLTGDRHTLPVLVKGTSRLWWSQCVCVSQSVCVTSLHVCVLQGWKRNNILCVTDQSEIHTDYTLTHMPADDKHAESHSDTPPLVMSHDDECEGAGPPERGLVQPGVRVKQSKVISYQGTVTQVVSDGAGLYVIDGKVGLCVAYQPSLRRKLRAGDSVELHDVHFLYRPCPDFPPSMLCTCLHSSIRITSFSRVEETPPDSSCPGDGELPRLLLEKNIGVSEYLWTCHVSSQLSHSLVPSVLKQQCVCVLSWKLMEFVWRQGKGGGKGRRDIYSEMLDEPHTCPLTQYSVDPAVHQYISLSELSQSLQSDCWSSVSLRFVLPPGASSLTSSQINSALSWSCRTLTSDPQTGDGLRQRPLLVVGVLELPSHTSEHKHTLQLRDSTGAVSCVITETSKEEEGGQRAAFNTAWIGCLVCVHQFTMVTERFLQTDFPSYQHLDQDKFITHKHCRVYLQFSVDHLHILSPSVTMVTYLRYRGEGSDRKQTVEEDKKESQNAGRKRRKRQEEPDSSCVSMVIWVDQKQGVSWTNTGAGLKEQEAGLVLSFSVRAAVIGPVVSWEWDPKNRPMADRERETGKEKVVLVFSGVSARWFPLLQPGCFYRVVAANTQDPSVLIGCCVSGKSGVELHTDSTLYVRNDWRFHTLTRPLLLPTCIQMVPPSVLSVSEVLDSSSELVSFQGLVSDRIGLNDRITRSGHTYTGVRLTMCDQTGRSLQVYLDLSHTPYPPGLLPGNRLLMCGFQRKLSRSKGVYCTYLPVSSVTVVSLGDISSARPPPAPIMHLGAWAVSREQRCTVGQVRGHVVCFLFLQLQWSCSLCGALYTQACSSSQCASTFSVFQSKAKLVVDDGTGEAHVWLSGDLVRLLLGLAESQWEGLQRVLRVKGHIRAYPRGRSLVSDGGSDDSLLHFLLCVCSSAFVCRPLSLTCRKLHSHRSEEMKRFSRGDRDFMTKMGPPLQLVCLSINAD